jgi:hypothetical protein
MTPGQSPSLWKLNSALVNDSWIKEEIKRELREYCELSENEPTT